MARQRYIVWKTYSSRFYDRFDELRDAVEDMPEVHIERIELHSALLEAEESDAERLRLRLGSRYGMAVNN